MKEESSISSSICLALLTFTLLCSISVLLPMTIKGGTSQACAACKYQRRRCSKECALAPYFPAEKTKEFQNAHRLFGVRNIMNILKQVPPQSKEDAMTSIVFESDMRAQYPVRGCMGIISQLHVQLQQSIEELRFVQTTLAACRDQRHHCQIPPSPPSSSDYLPQLHLGMPSNNHDGNMYGGGEMAIEFLGNNGNFLEAEDNMVRPMYCNDNNVDSFQPDLAAPTTQGYSIQQELLDVSHYDDIPFDTFADDRQSFIESKEASESSAESALEDSTQIMEHVSQTELKNAAACFTLTSVK